MKKLGAILLAFALLFSFAGCISQEDLDNAVNDATKPLKEQIAQLNADIAAKEAQIETLESEKADLTEEKTTHEGEIDEIDAQLATLNGKVAELEASGEADDAEIAKLKGDISTLEGKKTELSGKVTELENSISAKDTEIAGLNSSIQTLTTEKQTLSDRITELENANVTLENEKTELEKENAALKNCLAGNHDHKYTDNDDGTHKKACTVCGHVENETHTFDEESYECICGAKLSVVVLSSQTGNSVIFIAEDTVIIGDGILYDVTLHIAEDATVIFDVGTGGVQLLSSITVADDMTLTLLVKGDAEHIVEKGISLGNGSNIIIEGDLDKPNNKLTVTATGSNAGIGANNGVTAGDITIRNARVEATGSGSADSPKVAGAGIGTAKASMGNILIVNSIVTAAGGYYSEYEAHGAAIGMGSDGVSMGNITLIDSEITASHSGEGHASIIGAGPDFAEGDRDGSDIGTMGDIIITNTDLHLSMAESTTDEYAAMIGTADFSGGYFSYSVNMGKIIFTDITQAELDGMIATWYIPSDFAEYGGYVLGLGYWSHVYKYNEYEAHCVGAFGGIWVSDGNGGVVQIGDADGYNNPE